MDINEVAMSHLILIYTAVFPWLGENFWKMKFFQVREFCGWPGKFRKDLESQGI